MQYFGCDTMGSETGFEMQFNWVRFSRDVKQVLRYNTIGCDTAGM